MTETKKTYRSALRSQRLIMDAYLELMQEKEKEKITVTDLVDRADLNRSTFYCHYKSVDEVQKAVCHKVTEKLLCFLDGINCDRVLREPLPLLLKLVEFVESDLDRYRMLINADSTGEFLEQVKELVIGKMMSDVETMPYVRDRASFLVNLRFFIGGYAALMKDWCAGRVEQTFSEISAQAARNIAACIDVFMRNEAR